MSQDTRQWLYTQSVLFLWGYTKICSWHRVMEQQIYTSFPLTLTKYGASSRWWWWFGAFKVRPIKMFYNLQQRRRNVCLIFQSATMEQKAETKARAKAGLLPVAKIMTMEEIFPPLAVHVWCIIEHTIAVTIAQPSNRCLSNFQNTANKSKRTLPIRRSVYVLLLLCEPYLEKVDPQIHWKFQSPII